MPPPRQLQRLPPIGGGGGGGAKADDKKNKGATAMAGAEPATKAWMRRVLAKRVAKRMRMLKRSTAPPPLEDPGCGGECEAVAPPRAHGWAFSEYAWWRRHVWMPSRFYLEHMEERRCSCVDS
ncbi:hypothetical protein PVAP13_4KG349100 [Panicum virgatum]|uniref:Uncharacterized protein n=1 Tax=Panicum virgatum TaxID=38727 RepID=A0A8T0TMJ0_PANVG|nr:hypothetical protein PVAP13_4KG349100 [Panicum virgatum]